MVKMVSKRSRLDFEDKETLAEDASSKYLPFHCYMSITDVRQGKIQNSYFSSADTC